jgi:hypothetical protein
LKDAVREVMSENRDGNNRSSVSGQDMAGAIRELAPLIIYTVRQEISAKLANMAFGDGVGRKTESSKFVGPEYIPDIDTSGMVSNIEAEEKSVSGSSINDALQALKNLK